MEILCPPNSWSKTFHSDGKQLNSSTAGQHSWVECEKTPQARKKENRSPYRCARSDHWNHKRQTHTLTSRATLNHALMPHSPKTGKLFKVSLFYTVSMHAKYSCLSEPDLHGSYECIPPWGGKHTEQYFCFVWERKNRLVIWWIYTASGHSFLWFWQVHCLKFNFWKEAEGLTCFAGVNCNEALVTSYCETLQFRTTRPEKHIRKTRFKSVSLSRANMSTDPPSQHHRGEDVSWGKDIICCWAWKHWLRITYFLK